MENHHGRYVVKCLLGVPQQDERFDEDHEAHEANTHQVWFPDSADAG